MKKRLVLVVGLLGVLLPFSSSRAQVSSSPADWPAGVKELLDRFDSTATSATTLNGAGRSALFTDDATFINAFGGRYDGRVAVDSLLNLIYAPKGPFTNARIERLSKIVRVLSPDLVLVDHLERLTGQQGPKSGRVMPPRTTHITLVLRRVATRDWRIVYYRAGDNRSLVVEKAARLHLDSLESAVREKK